LLRVDVLIDCEAFYWLTIWRSAANAP